MKTYNLWGDICLIYNLITYNNNNNNNSKKKKKKKKEKNKREIIAAQDYKQHYKQNIMRQKYYKQKQIANAESTIS